MKRAWIYLELQLKRIAKAFPAMMMTTLLLTGGMWLFVHMLLDLDFSDEQKKKVQVGIVGNAEDNYLGMGIYALQTMDTSRFVVDFYNMSEEEAKRGLEEGNLSVYVRIPDDFLESVLCGENKPITYVTTAGTARLGSVLMEELTETISSLLSESQSAIYGMQSLAVEHGLAEQLGTMTDALNLKYIQFIFNRDQVYELELLGAANGLSTGGYYLCAVIVLFLMLWGIHGSILFGNRDMELSRMLAAGNLGAAGQTAGEFTAYLIFMYVSFALAAGILAATGGIASLPIREWRAADGRDMLVFLLETVPVIGMFSAMQLFLYELASGIVNGVLLQFVSAVCIGYLSGCFYPVWFFPESVQRLAGRLPGGVGIRYLGSCLLGQVTAAELWKPVLYMVLFLGMTAVLRQGRIAGRG
ncbi:MAG: ABC transporter permease [Lachnospiraceae bacterium]|nr:ABC transporter permease [Lachnospiraceae bacterium]